MNRRTIAIRGLVQGVGFRPFVYHLAQRLELNGFVRNQTDGVWIEVEGEPETLGKFVVGLLEEPPPAARVDELRWEDSPIQGEASFRIEASEVGTGPVVIGPDLATCDACLAELFDPADRHFHYPFLNCTHCGPRLTIVRGVPYDRERTTLCAFPMCAACRAEYDDPTDRRFHAQPTACPACGPRLKLLDANGDSVSSPDPLDNIVAMLRAGGIVAVKGLGGYHLACDACQTEAVAELRRRKQRDEKPFAVMVANLAAARELAEISDAEAALLTSARRPIVLLRKRAGANIASGIAPGNPSIGLMLPYTPLHHLLLAALPSPLVMTSGNRSDEPIAFDDADAIARLAGIADAFLAHNRPIHIRCDDSVTRWASGAELPLRRSRGYAPQPITIPQACSQPTLAVGGQLKSTFALGVGRNATLSHHLGDLDHAEAFRAFTDAVSHYEKLFGFAPSVIAHDLHPDYASTRYAHERSGVRRIAVQHHHAHLASCLAENGMIEPAIGIIFDGAGYGTDGTIWGGEFLVGDCRAFRRAAYLRPIGMPGGERAVREPWRMALAYLTDSGIEPKILRRLVSGDLPPTVSQSLDTSPTRGEDKTQEWALHFLPSPLVGEGGESSSRVGGKPSPTKRLTAVSEEALRIAQRLVARKTLCPLTSSVGRLFDAVAAIAGTRHRVSYEGQAAIELEGLATGIAPDVGYPFSLEQDAERIVIDCRPLIAAVAREAMNGVHAAHIARRFHTSLVEIISQTCDQIRSDTGLSLVALSGGVFQNALLTAEAVARLTAEGFRVLRHKQVPPGDGGLCLGQLAIAAALTS